MVWTSTAVEIACIYAHNYPYSSWTGHILAWLPQHVVDDVVVQSTWSMPRIAGLALIMSGALLNLSSRYTLGKLATFPLVPSAKRTLYVPPSQVPRDPAAQQKSDATASTGTWSLRHSHSLVTSGPFSFIRHPMYAGVLLSMIGSGVVYTNQDSILYSLSENSSIIPYFSPAIPATLLVVLGLSTAAHLAKRVKTEDSALENSFGKSWTFYRWNVPYVFIPGVY